MGFRTSCKCGFDQQCHDLHKLHHESVQGIQPAQRIETSSTRRDPRRPAAFCQLPVCPAGFLVTKSHECEQLRKPRVSHGGVVLNGGSHGLSLFKKNNPIAGWFISINCLWIIHFPWVFTWTIQLLGYPGMPISHRSCKHLWIASSYCTYLPGGFKATMSSGGTRLTRLTLMISVKLCDFLCPF